MRAFSTLILFLTTVSRITVGLNCTGDEDGGCQEVVCPGDSEPMSPEGGCKCVPARCHEPPSCPSGTRPQLKKRASLKPGDCCDVFECPLSAEEVDCNQVICPEDENVEQCPADSYKLPAVQRDGECCSQPQGCACLPAPCSIPVCPKPSQLTTIATGDGRPGSCCPIYQCTSHTGSNRTCEMKGKEIEDGGKFSPDACSECLCQRGLMLCSSVCPPLTEDCDEPFTPPDSCCPVCADVSDTDNNIDGFKPRGCKSANGTFYEHGINWKQDDCTNCTCVDGKQECHASLCFHSCANATYIKGECCPVCNETLVYTLPQHCPPLDDCTLRCKDGFDKDDANCFLCQCKETDCTLTCLNGFKKDPSGKEVCECNPSSRCIDMSTCPRKCKYGYKVNSAGCEVCKCCKPLSNCNKVCPHGFKVKAGCPICSCQGASDISNELIDMHCNTEQGDKRDDGESWEDHCRQCYCSQGKEMCTLIICPKIDCPDPLTFSKNSCCPTCPGSKSTSLGIGEGVCFGDSGSLKREGEEWSLGNCVKCRCLGAGKVVCNREPCPPAPCLHPIAPTSDSCCPYCPPIPPSYPNEPSCGIGREPGMQWRESECKSCVCIKGVSTCFDETCDESPCDTPVIVKNQCCPVCTDSWIKQVGGCRIGNITFAVGAELELEPCLRCTCLPGPYMSCARSHCSKGDDDSSWWIFFVCIVSVLIFSCVGVGVGAHHYCSKRRDVLKLDQPYQSPPIQYTYQSVPSYDMKPPI